MPHVPPRSALIVVDMQNDFISGTLPVPEASSIIPTINALTRLEGWDLVLFTTDFHPQNHISFLENSPIVQNHTWVPGVSTKVQYDGNTRICGKAYTSLYGDSAVAECDDSARFDFVQELWPVHCVQGTEGQRIDSRVKIPTSAAIVRKGITTVIDSYGAFTNNVGTLITDPSELKVVSENTMEDMLRMLGIRNVFVSGLALDYCVKYTSIQAAQRSFSTSLILDATKAVVPSVVNDTLAHLRDAGVKTIESSQLIGNRRLVESENTV